MEFEHLTFEQKETYLIDVCGYNEGDISKENVDYLFNSSRKLECINYSS